MKRKRILFVTESSGLRPGMIAKGLLQESHRLGMELRWREYDSIWRRGRLDGSFEGLVIWGKRRKLEEILAASPKMLPVISVISSTLDLPVPTVMPDSPGIARQVAAHLLEQGLTRFLFVGAAENPVAVLRANHFRKALRENQRDVQYSFFDCPWEELFWGADSESGKYFIELLRSSRPPLGIFAVNDQTAVSCIECIREIGLNIPREVAIVGVDDHPFYTNMFLPMTSVRVDFEEIGREAARRIAEKLAGDTRARRQEHYLVKADLVVRESSQTGLVRDPAILEAVRYLESHFHEPASLPDLARKFGLSRSGFADRFQKATGAAPIDYLIKLRLKQARRLLAETGLTVGQIAERTGFEDQGYFSRLFKRRFRITPSDYRKEGKVV